MAEIQLNDFAFRALRSEDGLTLEVELLRFLRRSTNRLEAISGQSHIVLRLPPQHVAEGTHLFQDGSPEAPIPTLFHAEAAGPTVLVFDVPGEGAPARLDPITLAAILEMCERGTLVPAADEKHRTRVELPTRMLLSISPTTGWKLRPRPSSYQSRHELWTARPGAPAAIRPVESLDKGENETFTNTPLCTADRKGIVASTTKPLPTRELAFSSQGAWLDLEATFEAGKNIAQWVHQATMGRDQFVRVVKRGFLYPTGHRAIYVTVTRRRIAETSAPYAYLEKRYYVQLEQRELDFAYPGEAESHTANDRPSLAARAARKLGMRALEVMVQSSPALDAEGKDQIYPPPDIARWVRVGGRHYLFPMKAADADGKPVEIGVPVIFVHENRNSADMTDVHQKYRDDASASTWLLDGQRMSLAPAEMDPQGRPKSTAARLSIAQLTIEATSLPRLPGHPSFHAVIAEARANLPEVERVAARTTALAGEELFRAVATHAKDEWESFSKGLDLLPGIESELTGARDAIKKLTNVPADVDQRLDQAAKATKAARAVFPPDISHLPMKDVPAFGTEAGKLLDTARDHAKKAVDAAAHHPEALAVVAKAPEVIEAVRERITDAQNAMVDRAKALLSPPRLHELHDLVSAFDVAVTVTLNAMSALEPKVVAEYRARMSAAVTQLKQEKAALQAQLRTWEQDLQAFDAELAGAETRAAQECLARRDEVRSRVTSLMRDVPAKLEERVRNTLAGITPLCALENLLGLTAADLPLFRTGLSTTRSTVEATERAARAAAREVQSLLGAVAGVPLQHPKQFLEHGLQVAQNPKQIFATLVKELPVDFDTSKLGGLCEPNLMIKALARDLGPMAGDLFAKEFNPTQFFRANAKILGVVPLADVLKTLANIRDDIRRIPGLRLEGRTAIYTWSTGELKPAGPFRPSREGRLAKLEIDVRVSPQGQASDVALTDFGLSLWNLIEIDFAELRFRAAGGDAPRVDLGIADVRLAGQLAFFQDIQKRLQTLTGVPGLSIHRLSDGVLRAALGIVVPNLSCGMFGFQDIRVTTEVDLSLRGKPIVVGFRLGERDAPFGVSVALLAGGGFIQLVVAPDGVRLLGAALEFGANLSFAIGVAEGRVYAMGGVYLELVGGRGIVTGYLRLGGNVRVLGIVSVSIVFYLAMTYGDKKLSGSASVTVNIKIGFFSKRVRMTVRRELVGSKSKSALSPRSGGPTVEKMMSFSHFEAYRRAFAS